MRRSMTRSMLWPSRDPSREIASALVLLGVMATFGATDSVWAQEIPAHPRQLSFEGLGLRTARV